MALFRRRPRLPVAFRRALDLPRGDAPMALAPLVEDAWAVASRRALHVLTPERADASTGDVAAVREPWAGIEKASFDPETTTIRVVLVRGGVLDLALAGTEWRTFATTLRERVQSSVVHVESVTLPGGVLARAAVRRHEDGTLFSHVSTAERVDTSRPAVAQALDELEERVRVAAGLPL